MLRNAMFLLAGIGTLAAGCNMPKHYPSWNAQMTFAAQSALSDQIAKIQVLGRDDRVAVVNLDAGPSEDDNIQALVEDALVSGLIAANVTVVERDSEALRKLVQEGSGEQLPYTVVSHTRDPEAPMVFDAQLVVGGGPTRYLVNGGGTIMVPPDTALLDSGPDGGDDRVTEAPPTSLRNDVITATKIIAYRVVDVGIRDWTYQKEIYRFANVVIHLRIVDANYGTVIWSGMVEEVVEDKVPSHLGIKLRMKKQK